MEVPRADGLKPGKLIGHGGCGRVFQAKDAIGADCAVKFFDERTISRQLLEKMTGRLKTGGWPSGVMPVIAADFKAVHPYWLTPLVVEAGDLAEPIPRNLQFQLRQHPGTNSWSLVRSIARALARMHQRRVAHGAQRHVRQRRAPHEVQHAQTRAVARDGSNGAVADQLHAGHVEMRQLGQTGGHRLEARVRDGRRGVEQQRLQVRTAGANGAQRLVTQTLAAGQIQIS